MHVTDGMMVTLLSASIQHQSHERPLVVYATLHYTKNYHVSCMPKGIKPNIIV